MIRFQSEGDEFSPHITLNKEEGIFVISGRSFSENIFDIYEPVIAWLLDYEKDPNNETVFVFDMDYFNSSTSKFFVDILNILSKIQAKGKNVKIIWNYAPEDSIVEERGIEYSELFNIPFKIIQNAF